MGLEKSYFILCLLVASLSLVIPATSGEVNEASNDCWFCCKLWKWVCFWRVDGETANQPPGSNLSFSVLSWPHDTSLICLNSSYTPPQYYFGSETNIKCASFHPISWDVVFNPPLQQLVNASAGIPYAITSQFKSCGSFSQANGSRNLENSYFESALGFDESVVKQTFKSIHLRCRNIHSETSPTSWLRGMNNSLSPEEVVENFSVSPRWSFDNLSSCPNVTLASDSSKARHGCLMENSGVLEKANYLNCKDWSNCQQLASHAFENVCRGTQNTSYCDHNVGACKEHSRPVGSNNNSGIIYCGKDPYTLYFFFQNTTVDVTVRPTAGFIKLTSLPGQSKHSHNKTEFIFQCSVPKFLALEGFEWRATHTHDDALTDGFGGCDRKKNQNDENYIEEYICELPRNHQPSNITVTCIVFFQSGDTANKTAFPRYTNPTDTLTPLTDGTRYYYNGVCPWACPYYKSGSIGGPRSFSGNCRGKQDEPNGVEPFQFPIQHGIIVAMAACVAILVPVLIWCYCRNRTLKNAIRDLTDKEESDFLHGSRARGRNDYHYKIFSQGFNRKYLLSSSELEIDSDIILGSGHFGIVTQGWLYRDANCKVRIAVKTIRSNVDVQYFLALLSEVKIMAFLEDHENIVKFMGAWVSSLKKRKIYVAVEFCSQGSLLDVLKRSKAALLEKIHGKSTQIMWDDKLQLCVWSRDIANGLAFISSKNVIHGDLAARNVLITADNVAKISDYGLSRVIVNSGSIYTKKSQGPLPWKWLAPESLESLSFGLKTDLWAYGVTVWEIFSLGTQPYPCSEYNNEFIRKLKGGYRLPQPQFADAEIYQIMRKCWNIFPACRPQAEIIRDNMQYLIAKMALRSRISTRGSTGGIPSTYVQPAC